MVRELLELFQATGGREKYFCLLLLRCPFDALNTLILASFVQYSFLAINRGDTGNLYRVCATFGLASLLLFLYNGTVWSVYAAYNIRFAAILRRKLFGRMAGLSLQEIEEKPSGEWFTRLNADVQSASGLLSQPLHLPHAAVAVVGITVSSIMLVSTNRVIFMLAAAFIIPHLLISRFFIAKPMTGLAAKAQEITAQNTTELNALISCADTAILYDARGFLLSRFEESSLNLRKANMRMRRRGAAGSALLPIMGTSGYLAVLLVGAVWISEGSLTFAELTAAFQYRGGMLMGAMMLTNCLISIRAALAGVRRVNETMRMQTEE